MNAEHERFYTAIHDLSMRLLEGDATSAEREQLERLVAESPEARRIFVAYMQETALLKWQHADRASEILRDLGQSDIAGPTGRTSHRQTAFRNWAAAVAATIGLGVATYAVREQWGFHRDAVIPRAVDREGENGRGRAKRQPADTARKTGVATLTRTTGVAWPAAVERPELSRLEAGDVLRFDRGEVEVVFDSGVELKVRGPADVEVRSADYAVGRLGTITARVGVDGRGFTIETPTARIMDLGTEFGIDVSRTGATEVAVFRGLVDLSVGRRATGTPRRLRQGEALRVDPDGSVNRVMAISTDRFPVPAPPAKASAPFPMIDAVHDNNHDAGSRKFYRIVRSGLVEDSQAFVDRNHQWNGTTKEGMPDFLRGIEYVMPYNDDKFAGHLEVKLSLARPAALYVFYSDSLPVPEWLRREFVDTGHDIGLDEAKNRFLPDRQVAPGAGVSVDTIFSVWRRDIPGPMTVTLGAVEVPEDRTGYNMYGIAVGPHVAPLDDVRADTSTSEP